MNRLRITVCLTCYSPIGASSKFVKKRKHPATGYMETYVDFPCMRAYLEHLVRAGFDPQQFLPLAHDVPSDQTPRMCSGSVIVRVSKLVRKHLSTPQPCVTIALNAA